MNILVYTWNHEFTIRDIVASLKKLNHNLTLYEYDYYGKDLDHIEELYALSISEIKKASFDAVFSVNYFPDIARACHELSVPYVSWTFDCPLNIKNIEETLVYPTNRAFFFDKVQVEGFTSQGINTAFHMPLGINVSRLQTFGTSPKYTSDISFIGRVYHSSFPTLCKYLDDYYTGYLSAIIKSQMAVYGCYLAKEILSDEIMTAVNASFKSHNCPYTQGEELVSKNQLAFSIATEATFENRLLILSLLSKKFDLKWYTDPDSKSLTNIKKCAPVDYYSEMPTVFKSSKINLHIGLHSIPSGISLRQIDILGAGGFLLSSFQPELFDYLVPGEDFDYFTCPQEAYEKAEFYLNNDDLRKQIAISGHQKCVECFNNDTLLTEMLTYV